MRARDHLFALTPALQEETGIDVDYRLEDIVLKGAWSGPASLDLRPHALAPIADLPVREIISAVHLVADLTLGLGRVVYDYLKD